MGSGALFGNNERGGELSKTVRETVRCHVNEEEERTWKSNNWGGERNLGETPDTNRNHAYYGGTFREGKEKKEKLVSGPHNLRGRKKRTGALYPLEESWKMVFTVYQP